MTAETWHSLCGGAGSTPAAQDAGERGWDTSTSRQADSKGSSYGCFRQQRACTTGRGICLQQLHRGLTSPAWRPLLLPGSLIPHLHLSWSLLKNVMADMVWTTEPPLLMVTHKRGRMRRSEVDFGRQQLEKLGRNFSLIQINGNFATDVSGTKASLHMSACNRRRCILWVLETQWKQDPTELILDSSSEIKLRGFFVPFL